MPCARLRATCHACARRPCTVFEEPLARDHGCGSLCVRMHPRASRLHVAQGQARARSCSHMASRTRSGSSHASIRLPCSRRWCLSALSRVKCPRRVPRRKGSHCRGESTYFVEHQTRRAWYWARELRGLHLAFCKCDINPFPTLVPSEGTRICETILMTPRAAADRPRALGYMVWMRTIDT